MFNLEVKFCFESELSHRLIVGDEREADDKSDDNAADLDAATRTQQMRILLLEDHEDISKLLKILLEKEGYAVDTAANGDLGFKLLSESALRPDLILLDLMMPVLDGFEFASKIKSETNLKDVPIIAISAESHSKEKIAQLGARAFLRKPLDLFDLLDAVSRHIKKV